MKKILLTLLLIFLISPIHIKALQTQQEHLWWDQTWNYRQKLEIPIDTSQTLAKYQPIDLYITPEHPCWAQNTEHHSLRVIFQNNQDIQELEIQLYNLTHTQNDMITSCNLVFIIPEYADGSEIYYLYYHDQSTPPPAYPDYLKIEEDYYYYAPIPGYPFESYYYKITQDDTIVYGVAMEGAFLGVSTAQQVTLFKENTKEVSTPKDGLAYASFDYFYYYDDRNDAFASTIDKLISHDISIDGNLMVEFTIISETHKKDFQTTGTYKYYYTPTTEHRRIYAHIIHEALKPSTASDVYPYSESTGNIAGFQIGAMKSPSIRELNFGRILPYMHTYSEDNLILEYPLDLDPEYTPEGIAILNTDDDIDLGENAWISFDDGKTGTAHALIFGNTNIIKQGTNERDGIQLKALEAAGPGLLGLESDAITFYCSRNSYETGQGDDYTIPDDLIIEYDAEFYSTTTGGYPDVDSEAQLYHTLLPTRPRYQNRTTTEEKEIETYTLTTRLHLAPSAPMGTTLSILTGKNISYITAELYQDNTLQSIDVSGRLPIKPIQPTEDATLLQKIRLALGIFDWRNLSLLKKTTFYNLKPGRYVVKIFRENTGLRNTREYIGFKTLDITQDTQTHIFCTKPAYTQLTLINQHEQGVQDASVQLLYDDSIITDDTTDNEGTVLLEAPRSSTKSYTLQVRYKGFLLHEEQLRLSLLRSFLPQKQTLTTDLHDLTVLFLDTWELPIIFMVTPQLTSTDMYHPTTLTPDTTQEHAYHFEKLPKATYQLTAHYKATQITKEITLPTNQDTITLVFPAEYTTSYKIYNTRGQLLENNQITLNRNTKTLTKKAEKETKISIPPGIYQIQITQNDHVIGKRTIQIINDRSYDLITNQEPLFPHYTTLVLLTLFIILGSLIIRKKQWKHFLFLCIIIFLFTSISLPWWQLHATDIKTTTSTTLYLLPPTLVSLTETENVIAGELASTSLPPIFTTFLQLLLGMLISGAGLLILYLIAERNRKKRLKTGLFVIASLIIFGALLLYLIAMSVLTSIGIGSIIGSGPITQTIPGEDLSQTLNATWGPHLGFYLSTLALILLISSALLSIKTRFTCDITR